jgi:hypothetical protein
LEKNRRTDIRFKTTFVAWRQLQYQDQQVWPAGHLMRLTLEHFPERGLPSVLRRGRVFRDKGDKTGEIGASSDAT